MKKFFSLLFITAFLYSLTGCRKEDSLTPAATGATSADASDASARNAKVDNQVALDWMQVFRRIVNSEAKNPPQASRIYAYGGLTLFESIVPGMHGYRSLNGQIAGLNGVPVVSNSGQIEYTLSANEAMYKLAQSVFGTLKPANAALIDSLHTAYLNNAPRTSPQGITNSITFGQQVATAVLSRAGNDGFAATRSLVYTVPSQTINPGYWAPTGPVTNPLEPFWGNLQGFAMTNNAGCTIPSTIPFSTDPSSAFYAQANEVATTVSNLTQQQKDIALWWADGTGSTPTPPGHWVGIGIIVAKQLNLNLGETARMFAELNMGMADAFIGCWNEKYNYNLLRPISYIKTYIAGQSSWTSFIGTPPFPEYPSGHSVASGAAANILTRLLGNVAFVDNSNIGLGLAPRSFSSFTEAANEAAISRLYGGIHYREAIEKGLLMGKNVSNVMKQNIRFK